MPTNSTDQKPEPRRSWPRRHPGLAALLVVAALLAGIRGLLPIAGRMALERGVTGLITGRLTVGDLDLSLLRSTVIIEDAGLSAGGEPPVVKIDRLEAAVAWRELFDRSVRIRALEVKGLHVLVRRDPLGKFELISLVLPPAESSEPAEETRETGEGKDDGAGWTFALDLAALEGGAIRFRDLGAEEPGQWKLELDELTARRVGIEPGAYPKPARLSFEGSVFDADLRFEGTLDRSGEIPRVDLELDVEALPVSAMSAYVGGIAWSELGGRLDAAITYGGEVPGAADLGADLRIRDFSAGTPGGEKPELRWEVLEIRAEGAEEGFFSSVDLSGEVTLEGLSTESGEDATRCLGSLGGLKALVSKATFKAAGGEPEGAQGGGARITARIDELELREPDLQLVRDAEGFSCRPAIAEGAAAADGEDASAEPDGETDRAAESDEGPAPADDEKRAAEPAGDDDESPDPGGGGESPAAPAFEFKILRLVVKDGQLGLRDRLVEPFVETSLGPLQTRIDDLTGPPVSIDRFELTAGGLGGGPVAASGSFKNGELRLDAGVERVEIARFNPYLARYSTLAAKSGYVSSQIDLRTEPQGLIQGRLRILLQEAAFRTIGKKKLAQRVGVSLPLAMALLRNPGGDIELDVPFSREKGVTDIDLVDLIARATGRAVFNSLVSPLKIVGSVVVRDGAVQRFEPEPVEFAPGRSGLTASAGERLKALAEILVRRPGLGVRLKPRVVPADTEWLGRSPEAPPPGPDGLAALGAERAERAANVLAKEYGVSRERLRVSPGTEAMDEGLPRVDLELAPIESLPDAG